MEKAIIALFALMGLSFIGMAAAIVFDKSRLIDFFSSVCVWRLERWCLCYVL